MADLQPEDKIARYEEALERIVQWADAYPTDIFPRPDLLKAHALLKKGGMTLDSISATSAVTSPRASVRSRVRHSPIAPVSRLRHREG